MGFRSTLGAATEGSDSLIPKTSLDELVAGGTKKAGLGLNLFVGDLGGDICLSELAILFSRFSRP